MKTKNSDKLKYAAALMLCALITAASTLYAFAVQNYTVTELDDMVITLPDGMSAVTRDSQSSDKYFSVFGLDYSTTMQTFKNGDIYLQGMDDASSVTLTVTMTKTPESAEIGNYNKLSSDEMNKVRNNFLNMGEYSSCTPDQGEKLVWLIFDAEVSSGGSKIKAFQANTVYDGMSVNITFKRNVGDVTATDYATFAGIVSSVDFLKGNLVEDILPYIIIGGVVIIIVLIVLIIVLAGKAKKHRKHHRNNEIIEELAQKYNLHEKNDGSYDIETFDSDSSDSEDTGYDGRDDSTDEQIIFDLDSSSAQKSESAEQKYEEDHGNDEYINATEDEIDDILNDAKAHKNYLAQNKAFGEQQSQEEDSDEADEQYDEIAVDGETESVPESEPEQTADKGEEPEESESETTKYADMIFGRDVDENDDSENDEELVRQQARRTKFDNGYDFFEEAPKKTMGVISSEEIRDAEDYDVITEVEKRASSVEEEDREKSGSALVFFKKAGSGIKSFCMHFGYFCKNMSTMIKRKRAAAKRKKAEQERRERAMQRAQRERQRARMQDAESDNGLVRVHSRSDRNRRGDSERRPRG